MGARDSPDPSPAPSSLHSNHRGVSAAQGRAAGLPPSFPQRSESPTHHSLVTASLAGHLLCARLSWGPGSSREHADRSTVRAAETTQGTQSTVVRVVVTARRGLHQRGRACPGHRGKPAYGWQHREVPGGAAIGTQLAQRPRRREVWLREATQSSGISEAAGPGPRRAHRPQKDKGQC